jgi:hypothetical protein
VVELQDSNSFSSDKQHLNQQSILFYPGKTKF